MDGFLVSFVIDILLIFLGYLGNQAINLLYVVLPRRRLWRLDQAKEVVICSSNSSILDTGEYLRPATGIGQMRALALVVTSLNKAYGKIDCRRVFLSTDQMHNYLESDLILLGGSKNNELTSRFLLSMEHKQPVRMDGSTIIWRKKKGEIWVDEGADIFHGQTKDNKVITDFGLIFRVKSPLTTLQKTIVLLAGSHTYGTIAAAKYFTENMYKHHEDLIKNRNFAVLVSTEVIRGYPTSLKIVREYAW